VFTGMSQMNSRRQELLSRLKTTLAIVSQATGFDNERAAGEVRPAEQWTSSRDPRLQRLETHHEGPGLSEIGRSAGSKDAASDLGSSAVHSSSVLHKFDEMQDEDEFLYGSTVSEYSGRQQVAAAAASTQNKRADEEQAMLQQWTTQRQAPEEPRWAGPPASHQPTYSDPPRTVSQHAGSGSDPRWLGNTEPTAIGRASDQSQWMQPASSKVNAQSWGNRSSTLSYTDVDERQTMRRGPRTPPMPTESVASKLQGINAGMLEGILKLVASGTSKSPSQPHAQPQQLQPQPQLQPMQQPAVQNLPPRQPSAHQALPQQAPPQQLTFESQHPYGGGYGGGYPQPQNVYAQHPDQHSYISPGDPYQMPRGPTMYGHPNPLPQSTVYNYGQPISQPQPGSDMSPLVNQLTSAPYHDNRMAQIHASQPTADDLHTLGGMMDQASSRSQPMSYRPVATVADGQFSLYQQAERPAAHPANMQAQSSVPEKPVSAMSDVSPAGYDVVQPATATGQMDRTMTAEPEKQKSSIDKDTLSRLLSMIGCSSNVTSLMQELIKKDDQGTGRPQDGGGSVLPPSSAAAEAQPDEPQTAASDDTKPTVTTVPETKPEPAQTPESKPPVTETKPESTEADEKPKDDLPPEPAKEPVTEEIKSSIPVLSSLSRLQKNYDSPDESMEDGEALATKTGDRKSSSSVVADDNWERSTEEFLRRLQSKPAGTSKLQKEKSGSASRESSADKQKLEAAECKASIAKQIRAEAKKLKEAHDTGANEDGVAETDGERADLLRGKREIESALELLQEELANLRTNKKRLLESPSSAKRDEELENSIENERKLTDHMTQLKNAMAELNKHMEKLAPVKV